MDGISGVGERVNRILENEEYKRYLGLNEAAEREREFCRHDMGHFLDVARLAVILNLKEGQKVEEELIYAAALLHDIGRHVQYADGTPHEEAGAVLAASVLEACGFDPPERKLVEEAILSHRSREAAGRPGLGGLLCRADKLSRGCFACRMQERCSWEKEKKNLQLLW
ncbi:MAG: HD domain-containing protein [Kineothrix sp.]